MSRHPSQKDIDDLLRMAFREDIGPADITTQAVLLKDFPSTGSFIAKEDMVLAGIEIARRGLLLLDRKASFHAYLKDGDRAKKGDHLAQVKGKISALLKAERVILNIVQRLSGIATLTRKIHEKIEDLPCEILDTRKTTPGLRIFEKYAVRVGGGKNHRFGLFDQILIKENHVTAAGGIARAMERASAFKGESKVIEIEVRNLKELKEALRAGAKLILLDNFSLSSMRKAVDLSAGKATLEASGNIGFHNIRKVARTGVDYISMGLLTHSPRSVDMSFMIHPIKNV